MKRSVYFLILIFVCFAFELSFYGLDALNVYNNFIWIFATFVLMGVFIFYIRRKAEEQTEEQSLEMFEETREK